MQRIITESPCSLFLPVRMFIIGKEKLEQGLISPSRLLSLKKGFYLWWKEETVSRQGKIWYVLLSDSKISLPPIATLLEWSLVFRWISIRSRVGTSANSEEGQVKKLLYEIPS